MNIVTSYVNPDLDGVASALVFARFLARTKTDFKFAGEMNLETEGVMKQLDLSPEIRDSPTPPEGSIDAITLVDCHHPLQLPLWVDPTSVLLVIDHHSDGSPTAFPNATIQNEQVGAAATLITERLEEEIALEAVEPTYLALLACAIASNTLDFVAPSTSNRDLTAYKRLAYRAHGLSELRRKMKEWRRALLIGSTPDVLSRDTKVVESRFGRVAIAQLEAAGARRLLDREDLAEALTGLDVGQDAGLVILSLVDTEATSTLLVTPHHGLRSVLAELPGAMAADDVVVLNYLALRKTHLIPSLA